MKRKASSDKRDAGTKNLTEAEQAILARQRALAARSRISHPQQQQEQNQNASASSAAYKRPSSKKAGGPPLEVTAQQALAAARARVGIPSSESSAILKSAATASATATAIATGESASSSSASHKRPSGMKRKILSCLTTASAASATTGGDHSSRNNRPKYYAAVQVEDFWKNIRSWNFLKDLQEQLNSSSRKSPTDNTNNNRNAPVAGQKETDCLSQALPDKYDSYQHECMGATLSCGSSSTNIG